MLLSLPAENRSPQYRRLFRLMCLYVACEMTPSNDRVLRGRPDGFFASVLYTTLIYYSYMHVQNLSAHALHGQLNIIIELFRFFFVVTMTISYTVVCHDLDA